MVRAYHSTRREQSAAVTRQLILHVAQDLFVQEGYAATTVAEIARRADVAVTTVYDSVGSKSAIVLALIENGVQDSEIARTIDRVRQASEPETAIAHLAAGVCATSLRLMPLIRLMYDTAPADAAIAAAVVATEKAYRKNLEPLTDHLRENGWLRAHISDEEAVDILWFHFGISSVRILSDMGWSQERMQTWLGKQVGTALLA